MYEYITDYFLLLFILLVFFFLLYYYIFHSDGVSSLVQDGIQRMRWRKSEAQKYPEPMVFNQIYKIRISLWNTSYVFAEGTKIRVSVSSSNYPRFEANPNTGYPLASLNNETIVAHNTIWHDASHPSAVRLPVVQLSDLPRHNILETTEHMLMDFKDSASDGIVAEKMLYDIISSIGQE